MKISKFVLSLICMSVLGGFAQVKAENGQVKYTKNLMFSLINCIPYSESHKVEMFDTLITPVTQIRGWQNGKCIYVNYAEEIPNSKCECHFTAAQLKEIKAAYESDTKNASSNRALVKEEDETKDSSDQMSKILDKYLNDGVTCTKAN